MHTAKTGFFDLIWNENTKLIVYLAIWYVGNIYCKSPTPIFSHIHIHASKYVRMWCITLLFPKDNIYNKKACIALGKNAAGASNAHWALSALQVGENIAVIHTYIHTYTWTHLFSFLNFFLTRSCLLVFFSSFPCGKKSVSITTLLPMPTWPVYGHFMSGWPACARPPPWPPTTGRSCLLWACGRHLPTPSPCWLSAQEPSPSARSSRPESPCSLPPPTRSCSRLARPQRGSACMYVCMN